MDQYSTDEFLTIVVVSSDYEKIVQCNHSLDHSNECQYCVVAALTAKQGLSLSQAHQPQCIVIDIELADDELLNALSERFQNTPTILITNENGEEQKNKLTKSVTHSIALKNINNDGLHNAIQLALKNTPDRKPYAEDKYNNQRKVAHYNAYSYAEPKYLSRNNTDKPVNNDHTVELANILMVEDNIYDIKLAKILLNEDDKLQFNLFTANNGEEALAFLRDKDRPRIDLILLDINMPVMNGFEFLEEHLKEQETDHIPVIVCSTSSYKPDEERANKLGVDGYIIKPASLEKMRAPLAKLSHLIIKEHGKKRSLQFVEDK